MYDFLTQIKTRTTHFMIGYYIKLNPALFTRAFEELDQDIAVHTWSHRHMTSLSNLEIVGELGWSMEIIKNSTVSISGRFRSPDGFSQRHVFQGGRLPRYWRPPYGDADNRVRAIAKEVFGLQTIFWNQE